MPQIFELHTSSSFDEFILQHCPGSSVLHEVFADQKTPEAVISKHRCMVLTALSMPLSEILTNSNQEFDWSQTAILVSIETSNDLQVPVIYSYHGDTPLSRLLSSSSLLCTSSKYFEIEFLCLLRASAPMVLLHLKLLLSAG